MKSEKSKGPAEKCQKKKATAKTDSGGAKIIRTTCTAEIDSLFDTLKKVKKDEAFLQSEKESKQDKKRYSGDRTSAVNEIAVNDKKRKSSEEISSLPHGVVTSNNARVIISPEAPVERIDPESGYKVYKAHILKVGEGGGTALCPFDCDCCF
jgi:Eukaryotic protein of unknown function (DUF1764)